MIPLDSETKDTFVHLWLAASLAGPAPADACTYNTTWYEIFIPAQRLETPTYELIDGLWKPMLLAASWKEAEKKKGCAAHIDEYMSASHLGPMHYPPR